MQGLLVRLRIFIHKGSCIMDFTGTLIAVIGMLIIFGLVYCSVVVSGLFVRLIMRSLDRVHQLSVRGVALWALGTSMLVLIFELLGRFFLLSIDIQLQFATHVLGVLVLHVVYFIIAGLAMRALLAHRHHVLVSARDAVVFMACVGVCFYFLLGSIAGILTHIAQNYSSSTPGRILAENCTYVQGVSLCLLSKENV